MLPQGILCVGDLPAKVAHTMALRLRGITVAIRHAAIDQTPETFVLGRLDVFWILVPNWSFGLNPNGGPSEHLSDQLFSVSRPPAKITPTYLSEHLPELPELTHSTPNSVQTHRASRRSRKDSSHQTAERLSDSWESSNRMQIEARRKLLGTKTSWWGGPNRTPPTSEAVPRPCAWVICFTCKALICGPSRNAARAPRLP